MLLRASPVRVAILHVPGTNRDRDAALACTRAGAQPEIVHAGTTTELDRAAAARLDAADAIVLPGGFSFGDDLGAGRILGALLRPGTSACGDTLARFVASGRPVVGICNGFQALLAAGLLGDAPATLTRNASARFECRWVWLRAAARTHSVLARALGETPIFCPVAHAEGRFSCAPAVLDALDAAGQVALHYCTDQGVPTDDYPANPNGSLSQVAGLCNPAGNVLGLMPHPENHIEPGHGPRRGLGQSALGLRLFEALVECAREARSN